MGMNKAAAAFLSATALLACAVGAQARTGTVAALTQAATGVTTNAATLKGQVTPISSSTAFYFDYGTTTAYGGQTQATYVAQPVVLQTVQATISGLAPNTLYHYRLVAGEGSIVSFGLDQTFRTVAAAGGGTPPPVTNTSSTTAPAGDPTA